MAGHLVNEDCRFLALPARFLLGLSGQYLAVRNAIRIRTRIVQGERPAKCTKKDASETKAHQFRKHMATGDESA